MYHTVWICFEMLRIGKYPVCGTQTKGRYTHFSLNDVCWVAFFFFLFTPKFWEDSHFD